MTRMMRTAGAVGLGLATALSVMMPTAAIADEADEQGSNQTEYGRMMLVLDSSGSMKEAAGGGQTKIEAARAALDTVIDGLPDQADVGLRVYGSEVFSRNDPGACTDSELAVPPATGNRDALRAAVKEYEPYGETPTGHALREAAKDLGNEGNRSIVLVSDGEATCDPDPCEVAEELHQQGIDLKIDVVGLNVSGDARAQLKCIAAKGGGEYFDADSAEEITESLQRVAERGINPFLLEGTPIVGSTDPSRPTAIRAGLWSDTISPRETERGELYYEFTRTIDSSSVHVVVNGKAADFPGQLQLQLNTPLGVRCDSGNDMRQTAKANVLSVAAVAPRTELHRDEKCQASETVQIVIAHGHRDGHPQTPISIKVVEEPPVSNWYDLPDPSKTSGISDTYVAPQVSGDVQEIQGGSSFSAATPIESGSSYRGEIVPGETQVFKVNLDWGQRLNAQVLFPQGTPALRKVTGIQGPWANIRFYDPNRAKVSTSRMRETVETAFATGANANQLAAVSSEVRYKNRGDMLNDAYLSGDYYIVVSVNPDSKGATYLLPFTLNVETVGEVHGVPEYVDGASVDLGNTPGEVSETGDGVTDEAIEHTSGDSDASGATKYVVAGGLGFAGLAALAWGLLLMRRPRGGAGVA